MKLTGLNLQNLIKRAEGHGACEKALTFLRSCDSIEEVLAHRMAPEWAYWYALHVVKGRWPEAESIISTDAEWAHWYAICNIKGPWEVNGMVYNDFP